MPEKQNSGHHGFAMPNNQGKFLAFVKTWIVPAASVLGVLVILWGVFKYTVAAEIQSAIRSMETDVGTMKTQVSGLESGLVKTNDRIDTLLANALERAFPKLDASKVSVRGSLRQADTILQLARSQNIKLNPQLVANYGLKATALSTDPHTSDVAWKTIENLLAYRSFLNATLVPNAGSEKIVDIPGQTGSENFAMEYEILRLPGTRIGNFRAFQFGNVVFPAGSPEGALLMKIGDESKANAALPYILFQAPGFELRLDGYHLRNVIVEGARIVYNGGPLILENVYFVNCSFEMQRTRQDQNFANAVLSHVPVTFSPS